MLLFPKNINADFRRLKKMNWWKRYYKCRICWTWKTITYIDGDEKGEIRNDPRALIMNRGIIESRD